MAIAPTPESLPQNLQRGYSPLQVALLECRKSLVTLLGSEERAGSLMVEISAQASKTPGLSQCSSESLKYAAIRIASLRLNPAIPNEVWLIPRNGQAVVQYGYGGLRKLILRSPEVLDCFANVVCANDSFAPPVSPIAMVSHQLPGAFQPRGRPIGYYATAQMATGHWRTLLMSKAEIEEHVKRYVATPGSAWEFKDKRRPDAEGLTGFDKMAMKTCLRMLCNARDFSLTGEMAASFEEDEPTRLEIIPDRAPSRLAASLAGEQLLRRAQTLAADLCGDHAEAATAQERLRYRSQTPEIAQEPEKSAPGSSGTSDTPAHNVGTPPRSAARSESTWRDTIEKHLIDSDILADWMPVELVHACLRAYHASDVPESQGLDLAGQVLDWIRQQGEDETA